MSFSGASRVVAITPILLAVALVGSATTAVAADMPSFENYCPEAAQFQFPTSAGKRFMAYLQCSSSENKFKEQLQKHWRLVTDDDVKICMKYKGKKNAIDSYSGLMGCLSELVGERCYSGELNCRGEVL
jgi:hypothetical protein